MKVGLGRAGQGVGGGREQLGEVSQAGKQDTHGWAQGSGRTGSGQGEAGSNVSQEPHKTRGQTVTFSLSLSLSLSHAAVPLSAAAVHCWPAGCAADAGVQSAPSRDQHYGNRRSKNIARINILDTKPSKTLNINFLH